MLASIEANDLFSLPSEVAKLVKVLRTAGMVSEDTEVAVPHSDDEHTAIHDGLHMLQIWH
jgi:hypothetical protein